MTSCQPIKGEYEHDYKCHICIYVTYLHIWSQVDRTGHESPGEDCGWPYQTSGVN